MDSKREKQVLLFQSSDEDSSNDEGTTASVVTLGNYDNNDDRPPWHKDARLIAFRNKSHKYVSKKPCYMPDDFVNLSFFACCMFCPVGLLAVLNSYKVQYYFDIGDIEKSKETSERTHRLAKKAIIIGCIIIACIFTFLITIALIFTMLFKPNQFY